MKRLLCADLHILKSGVVEQEMFDVLYFITDLAVEKGCETIDILGDLLDSRTLLAYRVWPKVMKWISDSIDRGLQVNIMSGNHDFYGSELRHPSNLRCVNIDPRARIIDTIMIEAGICWVPWLFNDEQIPESGYNLMFAHLPINGLKVSPTVEMVDGVELTTKVPVYAGDFHTPQAKGNIKYIGSVIHHTWNDANQTKRVIILDTDTGQEEEITLNHLFTNLVKINYSMVESLELSGRSRVTVTDVPSGEEELVVRALLNSGAISVECISSAASDETTVVEHKGWSIEEAIAHQIAEHALADELVDFHNDMMGAQ